MDRRKQFLLRMDPALWAQLERWAAQELRSVNGQIEYLLRDAVRRRGAEPPPALPDSPDQGPQPSPSPDAGPQPDPPGPGPESPAS